MKYDLLIRNGQVVDGTGKPAFLADIGLLGDKIVEIGQITGGAERVIDADGLTVSPGFVDPHTHYDAQICWDPLISCSSWHGVTTVIMGNCGVGVAPCQPQYREKLTWDLVNVEAIPFEALSQGLTWDWESFPQYLDAAERRGAGINLAFLCPLTPFRDYVMGAASGERAATAEETARIQALIREAVAAGAVGFSTTYTKAHIGYQGRPLSCRLADSNELKAYANVLKEAGRGAIEIALGSGAANPADYALLEMLLKESAGQVTFLSLNKFFDRPRHHIELMEQIEPLLRRGAKPQMHSTNLFSDLNLRDPYMMTTFESWHQVFNQTPETLMRIYAGPEFRRLFREELKTNRSFHGDWTMVWVNDVQRADFKPLIGKSLAEIAAEQGKDALDLFIDLPLADNLALEYTTVRFGVPEEYLADPRTLIGLSDGGAHVAALCNAGYPTEMMGDLVRDRGLLSLEMAVKRVTSEPADFFGIRNRGRLAPGLAADLAIFDMKTVGSNSARPQPVFDLPGGGRRMVVPARGMEYTIVNGQVLYDHQKHTGAMPGRVLRGGA